MQDKQLTSEFLSSKPRTFLEVLELLRLRLDSSFLFHTLYMKYFSEFGEKCPYYAKAGNMFTKLDLADIKALLAEANQLAETFDGIRVSSQTHDELS